VVGPSSTLPTSTNNNDKRKKTNVKKLNDDLTTALIDACYDAMMECYAENAREPYVHARYQVADDRRTRLVDALCDGNEELRYRWDNALFDITHSGYGWARQTFAAIKLNVEVDFIEGAMCAISDYRSHRVLGAN